MKFNILILAMLAGLGLSSAWADEWPAGPHLATSGSATIEATPDIANLMIEVNIEAKDAESAKKQADARVASYLTFLQQNSVEKKDIKAANLRTQPEYDYLKDGTSQLKGYRAIRQVEVTLRNLGNLSALLDGALKSGLNEIRSVSLGVAEPEMYKDKARQVAIDQATRQAKQLAEGFNSKLGPVYSVRYHVAQSQAIPVMRMMKADSPAAVSAQETYQQQSIQFDDQVDVVFELLRNQPQPAQ